MNQLLAILEEIRPEVDGFATRENLVNDRILDSLDIITLIAEIDAEFDVSIPAEEIIPENFNSAKAIYALINRLSDDL